MSTAPTFTPVHLLTGFLGSGKTTLLRSILQDEALKGAAVLINEFGEVGLDHHLIERIDETTVLLQSGCLCCTIRGELAEAMRDLLSKRERGLVPAFDRLVIESTGLADPFPILSTIRADPVVSHHFTVAGTWATIDAVNAPEGIDRRGEMRKQIASADRILLTKTDLVDRQTAEALAARLALLNPTAAIRDVRGDDWDVAWLLADTPVEAADPAPHEAHRHHRHGAEGHGHHAHHGHDPNRHGDSIVAFSIVPERAVDWTRFGIWLSMLLNRHGGSILRVKGILDLEGETRPVAVHGVQHLVHPPTHMAAWPSEDRRSRLVFIVDGLDPERIRRSFEGFVLGPSAKAAGRGNVEAA
ncbi:GTP-binding protein [Aurantimonas sp. Leaf443]|uniref:CobW family GTP-binding protein n=1 Tax=Aurantimonas sp. Leaf443 TaxID=1736378 RepID=UPI0006F64B83|nr:GTP-binding protein [Aurantimonas sp. Leaf443]KQT82813.1 cobalamin biosynthesis protein CobW [Aurantimonas sp. Leaf443]